MLWFYFNGAVKAAQFLHQSGFEIPALIAVFMLRGSISETIPLPRSKQLSRSPDSWLETAWL